MNQRDNLLDLEGSGDQRPTRATLALWGRAMKHRWPIDDRVRTVIVNRALRIVGDPNAKPREVTAAMRILMQADAINASRGDPDDDEPIDYDSVELPRLSGPETEDQE